MIRLRAAMVVVLTIESGCTCVRITGDHNVLTDIGGNVGLVTTPRACLPFPQDADSRPERPCVQPLFHQQQQQGSNQR
ncbi:hypothetical protein [Paraburkholderia sp. MM5477-R1]|uniref:hypothetical protein n=1 Tax=Paraburkholderia sp. MM5477-R1 TaxID=2991062 RepID=UPI003D21CA13